MIGEPPPRVGLGLLKRALAGGVLITLLCAAAVASAAFLQVDDVRNIVEAEGRAPIVVPEIDAAEAGKPRTIMLLGSDERYIDRQIGAKPRSDTILLVRMDPSKDAVTVMSVPRDLKVTIPGNDVPTKINAAYEQGGPRLTLRTVKDVLSTPGREFKINNVISVDFGGFRRAIDYVGCVYYDVDRRYFNDNSGGQNYAAIDIRPGYQELCGQKALDYVRHRYSDNDLVRAARQQDFLRQLKDQGGVRKLMDPTRFKTLARVFARYVDSDEGLRDTKQLFSVAKLAIFSAQKPVREVEFKITGEEGNGLYLTASRKAIEETVDEFMAAEAVVPAERDASPSEPKPKRKKRTRVDGDAIPGLVDATPEGEDQAVLASPKLDFPFYFPGQKVAGAELSSVRSEEPTTRTYTLRDEKGGRHRAYRMTMAYQDGGFPEYYGVQGTTWRQPPILDGPSETITRNGRELELHYDGRNLRIVAWRTPKAVYWISNTLLRDVSNRKMLGIAASLTRLGAK